MGGEQRGRSFCPSCEKKKQLLWEEWLQKEVVEPVPHRHVVLTMPRLLRGIFRRRRELRLDLSQCGAEALSEYIKGEVRVNTRPGIVVSVASAGDLLHWHPHGYILVTDSAFSDDGAFHPLETWDGDAVMNLFRERLLARLADISPTRARTGPICTASTPVGCEAREERKKAGGAGVARRSSPLLAGSGDR